MSQQLIYVYESSSKEIKLRIACNRFQHHSYCNRKNATNHQYLIFFAFLAGLSLKDQPQIQNFQNHVSPFIVFPKEKPYPYSTRKELEQSEDANPKQVTDKTLFKYLQDQSFEQKITKQIISITENNKAERVKWLRKC
ncbi:hypothetical protein ABPG72_017741 [Tetrahymena utriculariae]